MIRYLIRRLLVMVCYGGVPCHEPRCGRRTVGFSIWCRYHTDLILIDSFEECRERVEAGKRPWGG